VGAERALAAEVGAETLLRRRLKPVVDGYDVALVDTPPTLGVLTVGALVAADQVLVPVEAHVMAH
jgi:chromosome partitioning protein